MLYNPKYGNYLIHLEHQMLTLFVLLLTISQEKLLAITLKGTYSKYLPQMGTVLYRPSSHSVELDVTLLITYVYPLLLIL